MLTYYNQLIDEFTKIMVRVEILNLKYDEPVIKKRGPKIEHHLFKVFFQNKYIVECHDFSTYIPINHAYVSYLDTLRIKYYDEVNNDLDSELDYFKATNQLIIQKNRFSELLLNYENEVDLSRGLIFKNNKLMNFSIDNNLASISRMDLLEILNSFYISQIDTINQIISFLNERKAYLNSIFSDENWDKRKIRLQAEPIELLDRYQTALLFDYLKEVGAIIKDLPQKRMSVSVSELTGHSENTLRTEAFPFITQIKSGKEGNKNFLRNDKAYALKKVKIVIEDLLQKVQDDINTIFPPKK